MDEMDQAPPEVTLEPADNGWVVRHHQRSDKKDTPGRIVRRVASTDDEALAHARTAMSAGKSKSKSSKKKSNRDGQTGSGSADAEGESGLSSSPAAHKPGSVVRVHSARRRPIRSRRRA